MKPNPCASRFREKISFAVCEVLAARQGLAIYRSHLTNKTDSASTNVGWQTQKRYLVCRADWVDYKDYIVCPQLSDLWAALTVKGTK